MFEAFVLNPFPELLSFGLIGATILRVVAGVLFVRIGARAVKQNTQSLAWVDLVGGLMLIFGFYTQIAAILLGLRIAFLWYTRFYKNKLSPPQSDLYALLLAICISLLLTGAGLFALDLPL